MTRLVVMLVVVLMAALAAVIAGLIRFQLSHKLPDAFLFGGGAFIVVTGLLITVLGTLQAFPS